MNYIRSGRTDKKAKKAKVGDKKKKTLIEGRTLKGKYNWTTKHQTDKPGKFYTVNESISLRLTMVPTRRGQLLVLTPCRLFGGAAGKAMHKAILNTLVIADDNRAEESPDED